MKRSLFLSATLLLIVACTSEEISIDMDTVQAESENSMDCNEMYRIAEEQSVAYNHYQRIMELMGTQTRDGSSQNEIAYPNYYGGAYINDDNKLVLLVKKEFTTTRAASNFTSLISDDIIVNECKYSYNELQEVMEIIVDKIEQNPSFAKKIGVLGIMESENKVLVCLYDKSDVNTNWFKNEIIGTEMIQFEETTPIVEPEGIRFDSCDMYTRSYSYNTFDCGDPFMVHLANNKGKFGSIGYRARDESGSVGYVTAAHNFIDSLGYFHNIARAPIAPYPLLGHVANECWAFNDGYLDAAFVRVSPDCHITNNLPVYMGDTLSTEILEPRAGHNVLMFGQKTLSETSSYVTGRVISTSGVVFDVIGDSQIVRVSDVIFAEKYGKLGDSGGVVIGLSSKDSSVYLFPHTVGIHKGTFTYNGRTYSVTIKAKNINERFNLTRY